MRRSLEKTSDGLLEVQNTEKKKKDICVQIAKTLDEGTWTATATASLKGRLGFAEDQLFGRSTRRLINELGVHAVRPPEQNKVLEHTERALEAVAAQMRHSPPRLVDANADEVLCIFTNASFCRWFMDEDQEQAIEELEAFAVLVAFHLCGKKLAKKARAHLSRQRGVPLPHLQGICQQP